MLNSFEWSMPSSADHKGGLVPVERNDSLYIAGSAIDSNFNGACWVSMLSLVESWYCEEASNWYGVKDSAMSEKSYFVVVLFSSATTADEPVVSALEAFDPADGAADAV